MTTLLQVIVLIFIVFFIFPGRKIFRRSKHLQDGRKLISSSSLMLRKFGSSRGYNADYYFDMQYLYEVADVSPPRYHSPALLRRNREQRESVVVQSGQSTG